MTSASEREADSRRIATAFVCTARASGLMPISVGFSECRTSTARGCSRRPVGLALEQFLEPSAGRRRASSLFRSP